LPKNTRAAIVFAGGLGLGAYHAGAYQRFDQTDDFTTDWFAGSSVGAITAALLAGNAPDSRIARLREFWSEPNIWQPLRMFASSNIRHGQNWMSAIQTRLFGAPGHFRPRTPGMPFEDFRSLYDLAPMRQTLENLIDFELLNSGEPRLSVATTDIEKGQVILFDTAREKLGIDHLLASCGMIPEFAPVTIGGRLLGDGGLAANAPFESILADEAARLVLVLDLFARDGDRPRSFAAALARKNELMFSNQTLRTLEFWRATNPVRNDGRRVVYLSYRATSDEADAEKLFDLSSLTVQERWEAGARDMHDALLLARSSTDPLLVLRGS
jgi:NTE family protein